ncbi:MAG: dihydroorotase [Chitinophagia bacterium]
MTILLSQVKIADTRSPFNGLVKDILIKDQTIISISDHYKGEADQVVDSKNNIVTPGFVDPFVHFCDPGFEHRETLTTGSNAAIQGGFTTVFVIPNTTPVIDNKSQVTYIKQHSQDLPIHILPIGALSKKLEGKDLAEMIDMHSNGAVAFSDGLYPVQSTLLFLKALQYVKAFDGVVIQMPIDKSLGSLGLMNEGILSTKLGLPGIPAIAEELIISRDIELLKYTQSQLHITGVSTAKGIELIRAAKKEGLKITCSVTPYHLYFTEEDLKDYDTLLKVFPPLRTKLDQKALFKAIEDGTIDCISSHHMPQDWDAKTIEFENAKAGIACIETSFATIHQLFPKLTENRIAELFSINARSIFKLNNQGVTEGSSADLTWFSKTETTLISQKESKSKSANSPFWNIKLTGKIIGSYSKGILHLN